MPSGVASHRLARRTVLILAGAMLAMALLALATAGWLSWNQETRREANLLATLLDVSAPNAEAACFAEDGLLAEQLVRSLAGTPAVASAILRGNRGVLGRANHPGASDPEPDRPRFARKLMSPVQADLQIGELILIPAATQFQLQVPRHDLPVLAVLALLTLIALLGYVLATRLHDGLVAPLKELAQQLAHLDPHAGQLPRPRNRAPQELTALTATLNQKLGQLQTNLRHEREQNQRLGREKRRAQAILENLPIGLFVLDGDHGLEAWNPAFLRLLGLERTPPSLGTDMPCLFKTNADLVEQALLRCQTETHPVTEAIRERLPDHSGHRWFRLHLERIGPDWIQGLLDPLPMGSDMDQDDPASRDSLTGLLNRLGAERAIAERLANDATGFGLMLVSLENLPALCASLGQETGWEVLRGAIRRLAGPIRPTDLVARLGDRELLIILGSLESQERALEISERVIEELTATPVPVADGTPVQLSVNLGIALMDISDEPSREVLLRRADAALREARRRGPNRIRFS